MKVQTTMLRVATAVILPATFATNVFAYTTEKFTPEANQAAYWGTSCVKYDDISSESYTAPANATKVIVKGGTLNAVYTSAPFRNLTAATNPKNGKSYGISHVIVCTGSVKSTPAPTATPIPTPETPTKISDKEDKNQSACNPSDINGAEKHRDDGVNCSTEKSDKNVAVDKVDKNQSACNPSDTNSANLKHRDDGVNCVKSVGKVSDAAASTVKTAAIVKSNAVVAASAATTPESIAATGGIAFMAPVVAAGGAYLATYFLRRKI